MLCPLVAGTTRRDVRVPDDVRFITISRVYLAKNRDGLVDMMRQCFAAMRSLCIAMMSAVIDLVSFVSRKHAARFDAVAIRNRQKQHS